MPYGELIKEAFRIARGHRYLWPFGVFAGTTFSFNWNFGGDGSGGGGGLDVDPGVLAAIAVAAVALGLLFLALGVISHAALPRAVAAIWRGERPGFRETLEEGRPVFWRVLGLGALVVAIAFGLLVAVVVPLGLMVGGTFAVTEADLPRVLAVVGAVLAGLAALVLLFLPLFMAGQYALRELVLGGRRVAESLRAGWRLLRANVGRSLVVLLIQQGISIGACLILVIGLLVPAIPAIVAAVAAEGALVVVVVAVSALVLVPLALAGFGAIGAWSHTFWTLAWMRLTWPQPPSERPY